MLGLGDSCPPTEQTQSGSAAGNAAVPPRPHGTAAKAASWGVRRLLLAASLVVLAGFAWAARSFRAGKPDPARS
jgi:hypothetical protein